MSAMDKMLSKMSKMYPLLVLVGFMIVIVSFLIGLVNSGTAADYYDVDKTTRDSATDSATLDDKASIESIGLWLPYFKFLGVGLILGGIVMALRVIIDNLKNVGKEVLSNIEERERPNLPTPPRYAMLMPLLMMIGLLIFIIAFIVSIGLALDANTLYSENSIQEIDTDPNLTSDLQNIKSTSAWLVPLKFFAIAFEFLAIAIGLATIIYILSSQTQTLDGMLSKAKAKGGSN